MPDTRVGHCLGPKGSGDSSKGGDEGGPGPPSMEGDKQSAPGKGDKQPPPNKGDKQPAPNEGGEQSTPSEGGGNMEKEEEEKKSGVTKGNQRAQSEHLQRAINNMFKCSLIMLRLIYVCFRRINHMVLKPFAFIL